MVAASAWLVSICAPRLASAASARAVSAATAACAAVPSSERSDQSAPPCGWYGASRIVSSGFAGSPLGVQILTRRLGRLSHDVAPSYDEAKSALLPLPVRITDTNPVL